MWLITAFNCKGYHLIHYRKLHALSSCSQYQVNASEVHSSISLYEGWDYTDYTALAHAPLRQAADCYVLGDIIANGQAIDGSCVNILAVIKHVSDYA